jgi:hypothetical protein
MSGDRHKMRPWRPRAELAAWAMDEAERRGVPLSQVLNEALEHERSTVESARQEAAKGSGTDGG